MDSDDELVVFQWLEEEKSEFDRGLSSINDLRVGRHQLPYLFLATAISEKYAIYNSFVLLST